MMHVFKSGLPNEKCAWCRRVIQYCEIEDCSVDAGVRQAIKAFAAKHGRIWRMQLRYLWMLSKDEGALRRARNIIGPSGLDRITPKVLALVKDANLTEAMDAIWEAGGKEWEKIEDPEAFLREMRGEP